MRFRKERPLIRLDDLHPDGSTLDLPPPEISSAPPRRDDGYNNNNNSNYGNYNSYPPRNTPYQARDPYRGTRRGDGWGPRYNERRGDMGYMDDEYYTSQGGEQDDEPLPDPEPEPLYVGGKRVHFNKEIQASTVRLQSETGEMMGVMSLTEAMEMAADERVDVVCINEEVQPVICRLIKASKYKFEWERAQKASKKKQREMQVDIKELRLRPITDSADLDTKTRSATKFLQKGQKVKITMSFTGREQKFKEQGREVLLKVIEDLSGLSSLEGPVSIRGNTFSAMLAPKKA